jgi:copper homeostasis protein (lipoprotein)
MHSRFGSRVALLLVVAAAVSGCGRGINVSKTAETPRPMRGMVVFLDGAAVFTDCVSGTRYPIAPEGDARTALQHASLQARSDPTAEVLAEIEGSIVKRPRESGGEQEMLMVSKFVNVTAGMTCAGPSAAAAPSGVTPSAVEGIDWTLVQVADKTIDAKDPKPPAIRLDPAEKRMAGFAGCNRVFGSYTLEGSSLRFDGTGATRMMCPDAMEVENAFLAAITATRSFTLKDGMLALADSAGTPVAMLRPGAMAAE